MWGATVGLYRSRRSWVGGLALRPGNLEVWVDIVIRGLGGADSTSEFDIRYEGVFPSTDHNLI